MNANTGSEPLVSQPVSGSQRLETDYHQQLGDLLAKLFDVFMKEEIWVVELALQKVYKGFLKPDSVVLDIGANFGLHAWQLNAIIAPKEDGHLVLVDPIKEACEALRRHFAEAEIHNVALADKCGTATFHYCQDNPGLSSLYEGWGHISGRSDVEPREVAVRTVDELCFDRFSKLDFVKMDAEGAELSILEGSRKTIEALRPVISVESVWSPVGGGLEITQLCDEYDYQMFTLFGVRLDPAEERKYKEEWDILLIPSEKVKLVFNAEYCPIDLLRGLVDHYADKVGNSEGLQSAGCLSCIEKVADLHARLAGDLNRSAQPSSHPVS